MPTDFRYLCYLHDLEGLYPTSMGNVWAHAQIDEWTTSIDSGAGAIRNLGIDKVLLVLVVLKHPQQVLL